jgi:hypothetical protein
MSAIYSLAGHKVYRNGKHAATLDGDEITYKHGFKQHAAEIDQFLSDLDDAEDTEPVAEPEPVHEESTRTDDGQTARTTEPAPDPEESPAPDPEPKKKPGRPKKADNPEPPFSRRFGDLTPEVVRWRHENWPKSKFREHYHHRLSAFPDLQD